MHIGIIPARGGSIRINRKNMVDFGGKPLLQWSIEAALDADLDKVIVSSEDKEILEFASQFPVLAIKRDMALAESYVHSILPTLDALGKIRAQDSDMVSMLLPTSPFRSPDLIRTSFTLLHGVGKGCSVIGVNRLKHPGSIRCINPVSMTPLPKNVANTEMAQVSGAVFTSYVGYVKEHGTFHGPNVYPMFLGMLEGLEIDTHGDLEIAKALIPLYKG